MVQIHSIWHCIYHILLVYRVVFLQIRTTETKPHKLMKERREISADATLSEITKPQSELWNYTEDSSHLFNLLWHLSFSKSTGVCSGRAVLWEGHTWSWGWEQHGGMAEAKHYWLSTAPTHHSPVLLRDRVDGKKSVFSLLLVHTTLMC